MNIRAFLGGKKIDPLIISARFAVSQCRGLTPNNIEISGCGACADKICKSPEPFPTATFSVYSQASLINAIVKAFLS
jgi:hypothetical protein